MLSPAPRVLHVITSLGVGGSERYLGQLVPRLAARGVISTVVSLGAPGPIGESLASAGVPVIDLGMRRDRLVQPRALLRLLRATRDARADVVQTWLYHADLIGMIAGRAAGCRCIAWNVRCAETDFTRHARTTKLVAHALALLSRMPRVVIHNSRAGRRAHEALGYRARRWLYLPNGVDAAAVARGPAARAAARARLGLADDELAIGCFGRVDPAKGWDVLVRAVPQFLERIPRARFVLGGTGVTRDAAAFAGLPSSVLVVGERSDLAEAWAAFDFTTLPSVSEGWPNVVAESMAAGVPVVATRAGDAEDIVGDAGILVEPGRPEALVEGWLAMAALSRDQREGMGERGRGRMRERFDLEVVADRYARLYESLAEVARSRAGAPAWDDALKEVGP